MIPLVPALPIAAVVIVMAQAALGPPRHRLHPAILGLGALLAAVGFTVAWLLVSLRPGTPAIAGYAGWALMMIAWTAMAQRVFAEDDDELGDEDPEPVLPEDPDGLGPDHPEEPEVDWDAFEREFGAYATRELTYR